MTPPPDPPEMPEVSDVTAAAIFSDVLWPRDIAAHEAGDEIGPTAPKTLDEIDRFLAVLLDDGLKSEAIKMAEATLHDLEESGDPSHRPAKNWLPKMRARLKETQATGKGVN